MSKIKRALGGFKAVLTGFCKTLQISVYVGLITEYHKGDTGVRSLSFKEQQLTSKHALLCAYTIKTVQKNFDSKKHKIKV